MKNAKTLNQASDFFKDLLRCGRILHDALSPDDFTRLRHTAVSAIRTTDDIKDHVRFSPLLLVLRSIQLFATTVEPDATVLTAITLYACRRLSGSITHARILQEWGQDIADLTAGMVKAGDFNARGNIADKDNYRGLLLSLADDIRVIIVMVVRNLTLMRMIDRNPDTDWVRHVAFEANFLYAQLAHRLGLYKIKSELEDLALKYTDRDIYKQIAAKLNQTKASREAYIKEFIGPVEKKLREAGLKFEIKGRTKTISSIWHKITTKKVDINHIYDLFAIRVIIDTPLEREKADCWTAYSIVADMYTANPARMRDWISIPKSNGYESLHATVLGPSNRWVEVQFRTRRMDLVAEKGLAAHWKYKGGKSDSADVWMNNVRDILETAEEGPMHLMKGLRMSPTEKEVFVFTPKGDLLRLRPGSTVLDFAFAVHSKVGSHCIGAIVNGRHEKISYKIQSGDTVEIQTSQTQTPKQDWLHIAVSTKARNKIRQSLNEQKTAKASLGKEILERRIRNRKLEADEGVIARLIHQSGYKNINDFFADVSDEKTDINRFLSLYRKEMEPEGHEEAHVTAEEFTLRHPAEEPENVIVIGDQTIRGLKYRMAGCCSPLHGDRVFGFISNDGVVKIHKEDCPNARHLRQRYPYRIITARWSGEQGPSLPATLRITGIDDIGIVTRITSLITKEKQVVLRNISIDSNNGIFRGYLRVSVPSHTILTSLTKKIASLKGVKDVHRE